MKGGRYCLSAVGVMLLATSSLAQQGGRAETGGVVSSASQLIEAQLPPIRPIGVLPAVPVVGQVNTLSGSTATIPISAETAVIDLRMYAYQLESIPSSTTSVAVSDSVSRLQVARASAWVDRLKAIGGDAVTGRHRLAFADVAMRAGQDTLAKRLIDQRLAELKEGHPVDPGERSIALERSLTLAVAVRLFADVEQAPDRLARNLFLATAYAAQLCAIPAGGYRTSSDSTDLLYRQFDALVTLLVADLALTEPSAQTAISDVVNRIFSLLGHFQIKERISLLREAFPYPTVAISLLRQPNGRARLDVLEKRIVELVSSPSPSSSSTIPATTFATSRPGVVREFQERFAMVARLGRPGAPLRAHVWLNTSDSLYSSTPRIHLLDDGMIHVLAFGDRTRGGLDVLQRVQAYFAQRAPGQVQVIFLTATEGHTGPDIATPAEEIAWLKAYYVKKQQLRIPIGIWAGATIERGVRGHTLESSPTVLDYDVAQLGNTCVVVDGRGIVRAFQDIDTRRQEIQMRDIVTALLRDSTGIPITSSLAPSDPTSPHRP